MGAEEIGTILPEVNKGLKYFIVFDRNGKPFWATEGYKEAVLIKFEKHWFVIKADGKYLGFSNESGFGFNSVYYRNLMDLDEIAEYDTDNSPKNTSDLDLLNYKNYSVNMVTESVSESIEDSVEELNSEIQEQTQEIQEEMEETLVLTEKKISSLKKFLEIYRQKNEYLESANKELISKIQKLEKEKRELKDNLIMDSSWDKKRDETTGELIKKKNEKISEQDKIIKGKDKIIQFLMLGNIALIIAFVVFFVKTIL